VNNRLKISIFVSLFFISCYQTPSAQNYSSITGKDSSDTRLHIGDEFTYLVNYAFLNLGEVKTKVYSKDIIDGRTIYKSIAHIDSYEGLPFVNIHQNYESWFDSTFHPIYFNALNFTENDTFFTRYHFAEDNSIHVLKGKLNSDKISIDTTVNVIHHCQDGLSLLYYARFITGLHKLQMIPCFINEDTAMTHIVLDEENETVSIEALDYGVDCFRIDGNIGFTGVFGLTGDFTGWFTNDEYKVPLYADLQVMIGNISIELIDWDRGKWQPPAYK